MHTTLLKLLICAVLSTFLHSIYGYVEMHYPDECFFDLVRYNETTGFFFYLNPFRRSVYSLPEWVLTSTKVIRVNFNFVCSIILHGMRDPMRPWVLCCKLKLY
uniref:Secreted protein n=1 Tax=Trichobilharzia regenti TaxID=157069 RepID=A0AA85KA56_TRIRE|nr:unnamed protein product [Trichobilharzia regenti]